MKAYISWEDLRGPGQDGKGKNKANSDTYDTVAQQPGIMS